MTKHIVIYTSDIPIAVQILCHANDYEESITYEIQNLSLVPQLNKEYQYKLVVLEQGA